MSTEIVKENVNPVVEVPLTFGSLDRGDSFTKPELLEKNHLYVKIVTLKIDAVPSYQVNTISLNTGKGSWSYTGDRVDRVLRLSYLQIR